MNDPTERLTRESRDVVMLYREIAAYPTLVAVVDERLRQWNGSVSRRAFEETAKNVMYKPRMDALKRQRSRDAVEG